MQLRCAGVAQQSQPEKRFAFVFEFPAPNNPPISLSGAVAPNAPKTLAGPTLGEKFRIARSLAETLFQFHFINRLHKSIRSENVLIFQDNSSHLEYCKPYLVGFEFSHDENDHSTTEKDDMLARNIYRHPNRWGPPEERFSVLHDIYALGVVLLEIGIWRPILGFDKHFTSMTPDGIKTCLELHAKECQDYAEQVMQIW